MLAPGRSLTVEPGADERRPGPLPDGFLLHPGHGGQPGAGGGLANFSQSLAGQLLDHLRIHGTFPSWGVPAVAVAARARPLGLKLPFA